MVFKKRRKVVKCLNCNKELLLTLGSKRKFCSPSCASSYNNRIRWQNEEDKKENMRKVNETKRKNNSYHDASLKAIQTRRKENNLISWNTGLTKEIDKRLELSGKKLSKKIKGLSWEKRYGEEKAKFLRENMKTRKHNGNSKGGFRDDIGHYVRSTWEANVCRYFKFLLKQEYLFEPKTFILKRDDDSVTSYTPDIKNKIWWEPKGHAIDKNTWICQCSKCKVGREKFELFKKQYPEERIELIGNKEYQEILNQLRGKDLYFEK